MPIAPSRKLIQQHSIHLHMAEKVPPDLVLRGGQDCITANHVHPPTSSAQGNAGSVFVLEESTDKAFGRCTHEGQHNEITLLALVVVN